MSGWTVTALFCLNNVLRMCVHHQSVLFVWSQMVKEIIRASKASNFFFRNNNVHMLNTRPQDSQVRPCGQNVCESVVMIMYWTIGNPDFGISEYDVKGFVNEAFIKVCRVAVVRNGVSCARITPLNRNVSNNDFLLLKLCTFIWRKRVRYTYLVNKQWAPNDNFWRKYQHFFRATNLD
jgi:hypothetical protein